jgi:hypothetical protein
MKILSFFYFFGLFFSLLDLDPDPTAQINADPDTDPKPWLGIANESNAACTPWTPWRYFLLS